jgi:hypothetical protein
MKPKKHLMLLYIDYDGLYVGNKGCKITNIGKYKIIYDCDKLFIYDGEQSFASTHNAKKLYNDLIWLNIKEIVFRLDYPEVYATQGSFYIDYDEVKPLDGYSTYPQYHNVKSARK